MASRISELIIEWLTIGGNAFSSLTSVPLVINKVGVGSATIPTTNGTFLAEYINLGLLWILGAAGASTSVKSSQLIVSSNDSGGGNDSAIELWRGTSASWQIVNSGGLLSFKNDYTSSAQTTYLNTAVTLYYNGGVTDVTYNSRTIKPLMRVFGRVLGTDIESSTFFMNNTSGGGNNTGYYLRNANVDYARLYINAVGTANSGDGNTTVGTIGGATLVLGNSTARPASGTAGGANNARGILTLYGTNQYNVSFMADNQTANRSFYIPKLETTAYAVPAYDLSGAQDLNTKYDAGIYCIEGGSVTNYPSGSTAYANMIVLPYRKPSGNAKPDYAFLIYSHSLNRLWFRGSNADNWADWREVAHIAANTAVGSTTKGIYVTASGVVTEMTYSLSATINAGTANYIAYYSGTNAISSHSKIYTSGGHLYFTGSVSNSSTSNTSLIVFGTSSALHVAISSNAGSVIVNPSTSSTTGLVVLATGGTSRFDGGGITASGTIEASGGYLKSTANSNTVTIGSQNTSYTHIYNSANIPFIVNNSLLTTTGNLGNATYPWNNIYIGKANGAGIYYTGSKNTYRMIRFINNTSDQYGNGISIGGGGQTIIGGGESADALVGQAGTAGAEVMWIGNDGEIAFYPGQQNGFAGSAKITMTEGRIWAGVNGDTTRENLIGVQSGAGQLYMWSHAATTGSRGIYTPAHGSGTARSILSVDTNNRVYFADSYNGNATALAYSQSGLAASAIAWLCCWNGYEIRAINKNQFALASHDHSSISGTAAYANYLNITHTNEIRFGKAGAPNTLWLGYAYSDGTTNTSFLKWIFGNFNKSASGNIEVGLVQTHNYGTGAPGSSTGQTGAGSLYFLYIN